LASASASGSAATSDFRSQGSSRTSLRAFGGSAAPVSFPGQVTTAASKLTAAPPYCAEGTSVGVAEAERGMLSASRSSSSTVAAAAACTSAARSLSSTSMTWARLVTASSTRRVFSRALAWRFVWYESADDTSDHGYTGKKAAHGQDRHGQYWPACGGAHRAPSESLRVNRDRFVADEAPQIVGEGVHRG
jgi:hypothetical protein